MGYHTIGTQVTIGSICRRRERRIEATILCSDVQPLLTPGVLWLETRWPENDSAVVTVKLTGVESGGAMRFDAADGPSEKQLSSGDHLLLLDLVGIRPSAGTEADVRLQLLVDEQEVASIPLRVAQESQRLRLRTGDEAEAPLPLQLAADCAVTAVPHPTGQGSIRWRGRGVRIQPGANDFQVTASVDGARSDRALAAVYQVEGQPAVLAVHAFAASGTMHEAGFFTKDLRGLGTQAVQSGEWVEIQVAISAATYHLDTASTIAIDCWDEDAWFRGSDDFMVSLLGPNAAAPNQRTPTQSRSIARIEVPLGTSITEAIAEHKRWHPALWPEQILVLHVAGDRPNWRLVTWWQAEAAAADDGDPADVYFRMRIDDRVSIVCSRNETLQLSPTRVATPTTVPKQAVQLTGRLVDSRPHTPGTPEPCDAITLRGAAAQVVSAADGTVTLSGSVTDGDQILRVERDGIDNRDLKLRLRRSGGQSTVFLLDENEAVLAQASAPESAIIPVTLAIGDLPVSVHKLSGVLYWPDSRITNDANYRGTPLASKRVRLISLDVTKTIAEQRPRDSMTCDEWRGRSLASYRPGRPLDKELTDHNGAFELRYVSWQANRRYFLWVEGLDPDSNTETPEYLLRTTYRELRRVTGANPWVSGRLSNNQDTGHLVIDHQFNLSADRLRFAVESLAVVELPEVNNRRPLGVRRPLIRGKTAFDRDQSGEDLDFQEAERLVRNLHLQVLPLLPLGEASQRQAVAVRDISDRFHAAWQARHPRGYAWTAEDFVLDARKIDNAIDISAGAWDAAWANDAVSRDRRRCELLEKTHLVRPSIPDIDALAAQHLLWWSDALSLADHAAIDIAAAPNNTIAHRRLVHRFVPLMAPVTPLYLGLGGHCILLSPGHGFYASPQGSVNAANWVSQRGGFSLNGGEDENGAYMAHCCWPIMLANEVAVHSVREVADPSRRGVEHTAARVFNVSARREWPRLWMQNGMYYLGAQGDPLVAAGTLGDLAGDANDEGIVMRRELASRLAAQDPPLEIMLNIHTNATGRVPAGTMSTNARGTSTHYRSVQRSTVDATEANVFSADFAQQLRDRIVAFCNTDQRGIDPNMSVSDTTRTFDHWSSGGNYVEAAPPAPGGWTHRVFPRRIACVVVELAFHTNSDDLHLLSRSWFRRRAAEAMSLACEDHMRSRTTAVDHAQVRSALRRLFGPTAAVQALANDANPSTPAEIQAAILAVTGHNQAAADARLTTLVTLAEAARAASTRQTAFTALVAAIAGRCGYDPVAQAAEVTHFIERMLLGGADTSALTRTGEPIRRGDLGYWLARMLGKETETLAEICDHPLRGSHLMERLGGDVHADKAVPGSDVTALVARVTALQPEDFWQASSLQVLGENDAVIDKVDNGQRYAWRPGSALRFRLLHRGIAWRMTADQIQFQLRFTDGRSVDVTGNERLRARCTSAPWTVDLPGTDLHQVQLTVQVPKPGGGTHALHTISFQVGAIL